MKIPYFLNKGDKVGILSTARSISKDEIQKAIDWLISIGLTPHIGKSIGAQYNQFAGEDSLRRDDLQEMIDDPNIKAIWCARGGYGTARILDKVDFWALIQSPKWIIGYSDVTALHLHIQRLGIASVHATMPINVADNTSDSLLSLENVLFGKPLQYQWQNTLSYPPQTIEGEIIGGNLSVIYSLLGSNSMTDVQGKILFLEDLDEYLYHIDRMMLNLKRNGLLKNLKALLVGSFTQIHDNAIAFGKNTQQIIHEHCSEYGYPILFNTPAGHISDNRAMILGKKISLTIDKQQSLLRIL